MPLVQYDVMLEQNRIADPYGLVSCDGVRYSVPSQYARKPVVMQQRPDGLTFMVDREPIARHAWAKPGIRLVQLTEHAPPKPQPRHERFVGLGDRVAESFGELGRRYVEAVEARAPHAPLAILREVCEREAEFGRPIVAAAIESLLQFKVIKRGTLSRRKWVHFIPALTGRVSATEIRRQFRLGPRTGVASMWRPRFRDRNSAGVGAALGGARGFNVAAAFPRPK